MKQVPYPEIPEAEFELRRQAAMERMGEDGLDALLLFNNQNLAYYLGFRKTWLFQWLHAGIVSRDGQCGLVMPQIMHEVARQSTWLDDDNLRPWGGAEHWGYPGEPVAPIVALLRKFGLAGKTIGVETGGPAYCHMNVGLSEFEAVQKAFGGARWVNATPTIWKQRMIKTPWEIDVFRRACQITVHGIEACLESMKEGITEREVLELFWKTVIAEGAFDTPLMGEMMFRGGAKDYAMSTGRAVDGPLTRGRQMFFDGGANYKGYQVDMQRQFSVGAPSDLQKRLVEISERGQQAAERQLRPGLTVGDVHRAAMSVIGTVPADLAGDITCLYSHTFMGHGTGLNIHEPPWITAGEPTVMRPGMIFSLEVPALDIPKFRVLGGFPEDIYLITADGCECLTEGIPRKEFVIL